MKTDCVCKWVLLPVRDTLWAGGGGVQTEPAAQAFQTSFTLEKVHWESTGPGSETNQQASPNIWIMMRLVASRNSRTSWTPIKLGVMKIKWGGDCTTAQSIFKPKLFTSSLGHIPPTFLRTGLKNLGPNSSYSQLWLWSIWWRRIHVWSGE